MSFQYETAKAQAKAMQGFYAKTGAEPEVSLSYLRAAGWNVIYAVQDFKGDAENAEWVAIGLLGLFTLRDFGGARA